MIVRKLHDYLRQSYLEFSDNIQLGILKDVSQDHVTFDERYIAKSQISKKAGLYMSSREDGLKGLLSYALSTFLEPLTIMNPLFWFVMEKEQKVPTELIKGLGLIKKTEWAIMFYENGKLKEVHPFIYGDEEEIEPEIAEYTKQIRQKHN